MKDNIKNKFARYSQGTYEFLSIEQVISYCDDNSTTRLVEVLYNRGLITEGDVIKILRPYHFSSEVMVLEPCVVEQKNEG